MKEILDLKAQLLQGNFQDAIKLVNQLETMARQDKINALENLLVIIESRLIVAMNQENIYMGNINEIRNSLIEIQQRNRLGEQDFYIPADNWQPHLENTIPWAILIAVETTEICEEIDAEQLKNKINFELLKSQTLELVRLTYSLDAYEIDRYLRNKWSEREIYFY